MRRSDVDAGADKMARAGVGLGRLLYRFSGQTHHKPAEWRAQSAFPERLWSRQLLDGSCELARLCAQASRSRARRPSEGLARFFVPEKRPLCPS